MLECHCACEDGKVADVIQASDANLFLNLLKHTSKTAKWPHGKRVRRKQH